VFVCAVAARAQNREGAVMDVRAAPLVLTGKLIDAETREPALGLTIRDISTGDKRPLLPSFPIGSAGFEMQAPGGLPLVIVIEPSFLSEGSRLMTKFTPEQVEETDLSYEPIYPFGRSGELRPARPAGARVMDLGSFHVRGTEYRRARIEWQGCEGQLVDVYLYRRGSNVPEMQQRTMCRELLLRGLIPGELYRLEVESPPTATRDHYSYGAADFHVGTRNPEVRIAMQQGVTIEGRIKLAEGSAPWPKDLEAGLVQRNHADTAPVDDEGHFQFEAARLGPQNLRLFQLGKTHIVQRITLAGKELPVLNTIPFEWTGGGRLEILLDDQPAAILGEVSEGDRKVARAVVVLIRSSTADRTVTEASDAGAYLGKLLPAGEYRVFAVRASAREKLDESGMMERLLVAAEKVNLSRGASVTLNLRVVEPR
jgi:hypothetical protein